MRVIRPNSHDCCGNRMRNICKGTHQSLQVKIRGRRRRNSIEGLLWLKFYGWKAEKVSVLRTKVMRKKGNIKNFKENGVCSHSLPRFVPSLWDFIYDYILYIHSYLVPAQPKWNVSFRKVGTMFLPFTESPALSKLPRT